MTNAEIIDAMEQAYMAAQKKPASVRCPHCAPTTANDEPHSTATIHWCEHCRNTGRVPGKKVRPMRAAIRALAACEPSEGMRIEGLMALTVEVDRQLKGLPPTEDKEQLAFRLGAQMHSCKEVSAAWSAMLAELAKE